MMAGQARREEMPISHGIYAATAWTTLVTASTALQYPGFAGIRDTFDL
jgi:hypothetical protein